MTSSTTASAGQAAREHAVTNNVTYVQQLFDLLRIPSVSTQSDHDADMIEAADFLAADMQRIGLEQVQVHHTAGHPIVFGQWCNAPDGAPTVLVYGHYDVQPPDPLDEWNTPPFEPTLQDGNVHARGAADDKGQLFIHLKSVESCLATDGALPVNVKFVLEGEEESGSEHLEGWVRAQQHMLGADICLISDSHMLSPTQPSLISSLRGMAYCEVHVQGPAHDLHSGTFGGAVRNPAEALANIIAQLKDDQGHILVPGFYDDVVELSVDDRVELAKVPFDDRAFLAEAGVGESFGEDGYTVYERVGARPTLEVNGIVGGYIGEGAKTVLPARASAKISMRLVANQRWQDISEKFTRHVESLAPSGTTVRVEALHGGEPSLVDTSAPAMLAAANAIEQVFGTRPVFTREGGSIPVVTIFDELLNMPTVLMGFGLPDDRLHSPNEKFSLDQFAKGIETSILFWHELAAL